MLPPPQGCCNSGCGRQTDISQTSPILLALKRAFWLVGDPPRPVISSRALMDAFCFCLTALFLYGRAALAVTSPRVSSATASVKCAGRKRLCNPFPAKYTSRSVQSLESVPKNPDPRRIEGITAARFPASLATWRSASGRFSIKS